MMFKNFFLKTIELKRMILEETLLKKKILKKKISQKSRNSKKAFYKNLNFYINQYKKKVQYDINQIQVSKHEGKFYIPVDVKILFVIRIRGINEISPQIKKILNIFRLDRINNGVFLKINSSTISMVKKIEPYVAYGYPSFKSIRLLLNKRGYGKFGKKNSWKRVFLSNNMLIQHALSSIGIYNIEDIIRELSVAGPRFKEVNNFLWPFQLKSPKKGYTKKGKKKHISEGGVFGNWENMINKLIFKMI